MNQDQQRLEIAKACGWVYARSRHKEEYPRHPYWSHPAKKGTDWYLPDYLHDLNAMAVAEHFSDLDLDLYSKWLWVVVTDTPIPSQDPWYAVKDRAWPTFDIDSARRFRSATAAQRAKAFLLTLNPYSFSTSTGDTQPRNVRPD